MKSIDKIFTILLLAGIFINFNGLLIDILEPDGALYATIAKHIALTGDWVNLWGDGHDWLDKPHLPFWLCAASFKIFGINAFAYKLPAFIFWLAGIYFTYKLADIFYENQIAKVATLIYVFALHTTLNNFDVRAEPFLTTLSIGAIYFIYKAHLTNKWIHIIFAALLSACAIMTKGIFVLITIGGGFVIWWIISRQWKQFVNYKWYIMLALIFLFIIPEIYCLYLQFDMHPEKVIFGTTHVSGVKFFFWDSQFGRFFNTGPIKGNGDKSFFLHTTLWAFLPWSILLYFAIYKLIINGKHTVEKTNRWVIYGSALITFLLFSFSRFQLPHYVTILFPQFSIITAAYIFSLVKANSLNQLKWVQIVLLILGTIAVVLLAWFSKLGFSYLLVFCVIIFTVWVLYFFNERSITPIIGLGSALTIILFIYLYNFFYPKLLTYQAGMMAGKWLQDNRPKSSSALLNSFSYSFEFYAPGVVHTLKEIKQLDSLLLKSPSTVFYTSEAIVSELSKQGYKINVLKHYSYFAVSMLDLRFLNPATRSQQLEKMCLIELVKG